METKSAETNVSPVIGTDDRETQPKHWYAAYVQINCERKSAAKLNAMGIETFVPTQTEIHHWSDRKKEIEKLVIPMMIFLFIERSRIEEVKRFSFIHTLLSSPGSKIPAKIPKNQVDQFKYMIEHAHDTISIESCVRKGDHVIVVKGPLKGLKGEVFICNGNKLKLGISIECLGHACVSINREDLEFEK